MEKFVKSYDKANMKKAIIEQEEIFRQQVHDLHRLYRTQKQLMRDTNNRKTNLQKCNNEDNETRTPQENMKNLQTLNLELTVEEYVGNGDIDESDIELTLATGGHQRKREEASNPSDSGTSFSSTSTDSGVKLVGRDWKQFRAVASEGEFDIKKRKRTERLDQFPWSLPCLSLKIN